MHSEIQKILTLFNERGHSQYGGEAVTQLQHALQTATLALADQAPVAQVVAALLHDVGHLLHDLPADAPDQGVDDYHENLAARYLQDHFGPAVAEPVQLHVAAKRFLAATEPSYLAQLSAPSLQSLALQGGPMSTTEQEVFQQHPFFAEAVQLRRWDDLAKNPAAVTPAIEAFAPALAEALARGE